MMFLISLLCLVILSVVEGQYPYSYCAAPNKLEVTTTNYTLELVQTITRHGDRTTLTILPGDSRPFYCNLTSLMLPAGPAGIDKTPVARLYKKNYLINRQIIPGDCNSGQLTIKGLGQHIALGGNLRDLYVNKYKFLGQDINTEHIWIRSTDIYRTIQSAQANFLGLFPAKEIDAQNVPIVDMFTIDQETENMHPNDKRCPRAKQLYDEIVKESDYVSYDKSHQATREQIAKALQVTVSDLPEWGDLFDAFNVINCYNQPLPAGITQDMVNEVFQVANWEYNYQLAHVDLVKLWIGDFAKELLDKIEEKMAGRLKQKYFMYSGHDTTIAPLSTVLGVYDGRWPPYASHIQLELWSHEGKYYVQVKYQGTPQKLAKCNNSTFCPVKDFLQAVKPYIPTDSQKECQL